MSEDQKARDEAWRAVMRQIAKAYGISEAVAYREGVWIYHSLSYPVYFASVPSVGVVGASNVEALVRRIRYLRWKLNLPASGGDSNASGDSK